MHHDQSVKASAHIVDHNSRAFRQSLQLPHRWRLHNIEPSKKYKARQQTFPRSRRRDQCDELAGNFVNHHELRVFNGCGSRHDGCRGNSNGDCEQCQCGCRPRLPQRRNFARQQPPQEHGSRRTPGSRPRLHPSGPEKCRDQRCPERSRRPSLGSLFIVWIVDSNPELSSEVSWGGEEITYAPLAHCPRSIVRHRSLQKGNSGSLRRDYLSCRSDNGI